ncbi:glycosyltransferase [Pseudolysinimonas sp.]|uniref:glycosyltransferase n=1 Tax=Pseudolysinimonas sp. TaxID=2680009 RepID=UPI003F7D1CF2
MRILIGCDTFAPDLNGAAAFAKRLGAGMVQRGHEVHVLAPATREAGPGVFAEEHEGQSMTVHRIPSYSWPTHPWFRFMMPFTIRRHAKQAVRTAKPDVVHVQSHIVAGRGLFPVAKKAGIRLAGTSHSMPENIVQHAPPHTPQWFVDFVVGAQWRSARKLFGMADVVTSPTQSSADYFEKMTGLTDVIAVSNGIETSDYTPSFAPRTGNRIVFVGRLDDEKHIDELVEATARLDPALDVQVDIIGAGEAREKLQAQARELGIAERIHFLGKVSDAELRRTLTSATVFAMPSRAELQCIAAMEAEASALPVVAANAMALPHLVRDGVNGHLYEPGDIDGFVRGLTDVLTATPERLDAMKRASLAIVAEHSMAHTLDVFEAIYLDQAIPSAPIPPAASAEPAADSDRTSR